METKNKKFKYGDYSPKDMYTKFGVYSVHFFPFEDQNLSTYGEIGGQTEEQYQKSLKEYLLSTVYDGIRYFFETPEQLKAFCEMVEA